MPLEGVAGAFEGITEAAGTTSEAVLEDFKTFSAGMITNADAMSSFNTAAQLVGKQFALELPEAMGYLSKVSAATGQDMGFMLDSLVKGVGRLSPMILDNLGIQVDLTAAYEAYGQEIGKTAGELTKAEQQTALMNQVMQLLAENTAAMPEVAGTAAAAFGAFQTTLQDTKDAIGLALLPVVTPLLQAFADLAQKVLPPLVSFLTESVIPAIAGLVAWFRDEVMPRLQETGRVLRETLGPAFKELWDAIKLVIEALGISTGEVDALDVILDVLTATLKAVEIVAGGLALVFHGVADGVKTIAGAIEWVIDTFNDMREAAERAVEAIPSWLRPGSPTPFELGLQGIAQAMREVNTEFGGLTVSRAAPVPVGAGGPMVVNLTYAPAVSLGDQYEAETVLGPYIAEALRKRGL